MATTNSFGLAAFLFVTLFITSCSTSDEPENLPLSGQSVSTATAGVSPTDAILRTFDIKYPEAKNVKWSVENNYYLASFTEQSSVVKAWFDYKGNWESSQTTVSYNSLSQSTRKALADGSYTDYSVLSANILERVNTAAIYMVKMSNNSEILNVYLSYAGDIIHTKNSTTSELEFPVVIPSEISRSIDTMFRSSQVQILDYWSDSFGTKAGIMEDEVYKLVSFDQSYGWVATFWEVEAEEVPAKVFDKFARSSYGRSTVEEIRMMESDEKSAYLFYLTQDGKNKIATIDEDASYITILTY